jgi:hypothetical protein
MAELRMEANIAPALEQTLLHEFTLSVAKNLDRHQACVVGQNHALLLNTYLVLLNAGHLRFITALMEQLIKDYFSRDGKEKICMEKIALKDFEISPVAPRS